MQGLPARSLCGPPPPIIHTVHIIREHFQYSQKGAIHSQLNWAILLCDVIPDEKTE